VLKVCFNYRGRTKLAAEYERYAIYWAPEPGTALAALGRAWLAHEPEHGARLAARTWPGLEPSLVEAATAEPARYGLHATLKAPFRLTPGTSRHELAKELERFAACRPVLLGPRLDLAEIDGFLALCPQAPCPALASLALQCLAGLDRFRAPLTEAERARRLEARLSIHQRLLLEQWGYPHVLSEYRFHITLTGRLAPGPRARIATALAPSLATVCREPLAIRSLSLFGDPGGGRPFRELERFAMTGAAVSA
jgi:putative phosphonate metabolism protein